MRVGVDVGGTKTAAVLLCGDDVVRQIRLPTGYGPESVVETAVSAVASLARRVGLAPADLESVGVGIPGLVDPRTGRVSHAVNLGLNDLDLGPTLSSRLGVRVHIENDVNAAALGAYHSLELDDAESMAYLNLGTGFAAGLVLQGRLWRGARGAAGEIGHIPIDTNGPLCPCGQRGCLELTASGSALARNWPTDHARPAEALFHAADQGDEQARMVRTRFVEHIASAVRVLVLTVDVDFVVFGGGMSALGQPLLATVCRVLDIRADTSQFLGSLELASRVRMLPEGSPVAAIGAALAAGAGGAAGRDVNRVDRSTRNAR